MQAVFHGGEKDVKGNNVTDGLLTKELPEKKQKSLEPVKAQGFSWSCWADLNRRPHPYQLGLPRFLLECTVYEPLKTKGFLKITFVFFRGFHGVTIAFHPTFRSLLPSTVLLREMELLQPCHFLSIVL